MNSELPEVKTARGREALVSTQAYRYRFPQSNRQLRRGITVAEAAERLLGAYRVLRVCVRVLAGTLIRIGPLELKIELAHFLYQYCEAAAALRNRLFELRVSVKTVDADFPVWLEAVAEEVLRVEDAVAFTLVFGGTLFEHVEQDLTMYERDTDPLLDQPSLRLLRPILADFGVMRLWFSSVERAALEAGDSPETWYQAARRIRESIGLGALEQEHLKEGARYVRPHACSRDERMPTFHHTRLYRPDDMPAAPLGTDAHQAYVVEMLRVQRDELDAVETFANVIYDMRPPFELELLLARLVWDEARHAEMGHQSLARLGFEPFAIPCGIIGINVRSPLPPLLAFAQISIFGELNQVGGLRRVADACYARGDQPTGSAFDFTHADEMMHLRAGRDWLRRLAASQGIDFASLEQQALDNAVRRLREEEVVGEEYANHISGAELAALIGE